MNPNLGPGLHERIWDAIRTTDENIDVCHSVRTELRAALSALLEVLNSFLISSQSIFTVLSCDDSCLY